MSLLRIIADAAPGVARSSWPNPWWLLATLSLVAALAYLRLVVFPDDYLPLTSVLALLVCLWHRDLRLLWLMVGLFVATALYKLVGPLSPPLGQDWLFFAMQLANLLVAGAVIHLVIRLTGHLEATIEHLDRSNAELEASNEELAAREEEISQQNEELQSQAEELEQQTEELNAQTEELQALNEQLAARERMLRELLDATADGDDQEEILAKLAAMVERLLEGRAAGAAVVIPGGARAAIRPLFGVADGVAEVGPGTTLAELVLSRGRAGALADASARPDIALPPLTGNGQARSVVGAPLKLGDGVVAALEVYAAGPGEWSDDELRIVQWLAEQAGRTLATTLMRTEREALLQSEREAREEAESANHAKDEFVATLSHELRTPLNAILGWASVLRKSGLADRSMAMKGLEVIERNARQQGQLISDLLDISRMMVGKLTLERQTVDLPLVIEGAVESVRQMADAKRLRIVREVGGIDHPLIGDPMRLQQVIWNLLSNAIKFTPEEGTVTVRLTQDGGHALIELIDTGEGMDPLLLPQLFERYRQADGSATRAHGGLGLGLAIVKNLVDLHGGSVAAHSDGVGTGATFTVRLPLQTNGRRRVEAAPRPAQPHDDPVLAGLAVLVVDDESDARDLVELILRQRGAIVHKAHSGQDALARLREVSPHLLISDIAMPGMDGYTLIRRIRQDHAALARPLPAIALTAFARSEDRTRALLAGFQSHVAKPVEPAELVAAVASLALSLGHRPEQTAHDGSVTIAPLPAPETPS